MQRVVFALATQLASIPFIIMGARAHRFASRTAPG